MLELKRDPHTCTMSVLPVWGQLNSSSTTWTLVCPWGLNCIETPIVPWCLSSVSKPVPKQHGSDRLHHMSHLTVGYVDQTARLLFDKWKSPSLEASCVCVSLRPDFLYGFPTCSCRCDYTSKHTISSSSVSTPINTITVQCNRCIIIYTWDSNCNL